MVSPLCPCLFKPDRADESENGGWRGPVGYLDDTPRDAVKISATPFSVFYFIFAKGVKMIHAFTEGLLKLSKRRC